MFNFVIFYSGKYGNCRLLNQALSWTFRQACCVSKFGMSCGGEG